MSKDDGYLSRGRTLLRSVQFFIFYSLILAVTGDCGDDGCLCHIKIACKEKNEKENQEPENQEPTEEEVGTDYSDDGDDDHQDGEQHHKDEHTDEVEKEGHNFNHVSCLKNIHNESYCEGWKEATCDMKNRQEEKQEIFTNLPQARVLWARRVEQGLEEQLWSEGETSFFSSSF